MANVQSVPQAERAKRFEDDSALSDFTRPFKDLLGGKRTATRETFQRIAETLGKSRRTGAIQFTIREGRKTKRCCLAMTPSGCEVTELQTDHPDLEILTDAATWADVAGGKISPLDAFGRGGVRVRGDLQLARMLVKKLQK